MISFYKYLRVDFVVPENKDGRVCIDGTSLIKYTPKHRNPTINRNNIICGCETCMSTILLQSDLNKWWLIQLKQLISVYQCVIN